MARREYVIDVFEVTSRAKCAALLKRAGRRVAAGRDAHRHQPRQVRGPIETVRPGAPWWPPVRPVTSRAKCAALLKLRVVAGLFAQVLYRHQPRQVRGPIETDRRSERASIAEEVTSRAKCAALLKRAWRP